MGLPGPRQISKGPFQHDEGTVYVVVVEVDVVVVVGVPSGTGEANVLGDSEDTTATAEMSLASTCMVRQLFGAWYNAATMVKYDMGYTSGSTEYPSMLCLTSSIRFRIIELRCALISTMHFEYERASPLFSVGCQAKSNT